MAARVYASHGAAILSTLIRLLRDFDLAEEAMHAAFAVAVEEWPRRGEPANPTSWIISTARFKAIDLLRRNERFRKLAPAVASALASDIITPTDGESEMWEDDRLRLIFTCCHPALALEVQVPLTLRTLCGLTTEEIARCFLVSPATVAQRIVRAKRKIRDAGIPYRIPERSQLSGRLEGVLATIYLIFTEGYAATFGPEIIRSTLCNEAISLARELTRLLPNETSPKALLSLLMLQDSRRDARTNDAGELILLKDQDRSCWDQEEIREGIRLLDEVFLQGGGYNRYAIEAAIAAVHARGTDWPQIAGLYAILERLHPTPVVTLNRAVAVGMAEGPAAGLRLLAGLELPGYHLLPAVRADFLASLGRNAEAAREYEKAIDLATNPRERAFLQKQMVVQTGRSPI